MKFTILSRPIRRAGAAGIATLMLATLAHGAESATGVVNTTLTSTTDLLTKRPTTVPVVPEANAAVVLVPVMAAMLFFSLRRLWSAKGTLGTEGQPGSQ
jgi:hypothetical protein